MKRVRSRTFSPLPTILLIAASSAIFAASDRKPEPKAAEVRVYIGTAGCQVELDASKAGETGSDGMLFLGGVAPGDHYIHVDCPNQKEKAFFLSPRAGQTVVITPEMAIVGNDAPKRSPLEDAEAQMLLHRSVQQAVRLRARGHFDEAVRLLREATRLDPENSDLHRELGITFLLTKQWNRARVEMLEAIRHDPQDADAHNGLGYALDKLGDLEGALKEFRTATRLEPDDTSYRQHYLEALGKIAARQQEKTEKRN